ncbi:hypothetical protein HRbin36_02817 [bacterium HR36]|nr:hypothetical protein HRbin36_02817 [bacterium HR36]
MRRVLLKCVPALAERVRKTLSRRVRESASQPAVEPEFTLGENVFSMGIARAQPLRTLPTDIRALRGNEHASRNFVAPDKPLLFRKAAAVL